MAYLILLLLNLLFPIAGLCVIIYFLISPRRSLLKNLKQEVYERFAVKAIGQVPQKSIWIHAASVGEVRSVAKLAEGLKEYYSMPVIVTTATAAGKVAALKEPAFDKALLAPLDFYPFIKRFIKFYKPKHLFIIEADLWPNMIIASANNGVSVSILNGRLSQRSAKRYKLLNPLVKLVFKKLHMICPQTQEIAQTYLLAGAPEEKIFVTGNIKYDMLNDSPNRAKDAKETADFLGWQKTPIITCGSTHEEEEAVIIDAAKKLKNVKFIIAPRHLERKKAIINALTQSGVTYAVLSQLKKQKGAKPQILLADTMGWLGAFYSIADICFVGGSIAKKGGHNFLEAAILAKPVIFGQYYYNTPDVAQAMLKNGAAFLVDKQNFADTILKLLVTPQGLKESSQKARQTALSFKGATDKTLNMVKKYERTK